MLSEKEILDSISKFNNPENIYIFGSFIHNKKKFNDIDILILYESELELLSIKGEIENISICYPLDVYYMTFEEEKELDFINIVNAIRIKKLCN